MSRFKKLSHAVWYCCYHIVWTPKYRYRILKGEIETEVEHCIKMFTISYQDEDFSIIKGTSKN